MSHAAERNGEQPPGPPRVLVVGSINMDLVATVERAPAAGETVLGNTFQRTGGGKGANQAVAAARLGATVEMVGKVGNDPFGRERLQGLRAERVGTRCVAVEPGVPTGVALITLERSGENRIIVVPGANGQLSPADVARAASLSLFDWAQIVLVQLEIPPATVAAVLEQATKHSVPVVLNPAPAPAEPFPDSWWSQVSVIVPNRSEAALLSGVPTDTPEGVEKAARALLAKGVRRVVITAGREGAFVLGSEPEDGLTRTNDGQGQWIPAFPVEPVDTVGAGDTFCAALATGLAAGETLLSAARFAAAAAAIAVTRPGASASAPTRAEVERFLESGGRFEAVGKPTGGAMAAPAGAVGAPPGAGAAPAAATPVLALPSPDDTMGWIHHTIEEAGLAVLALLDRIGPEFEEAVNLILSCSGRLILTGMSKPGHIARKLASTFNSSGTPAFFVHPAEGLHGDAGSITGEDVIIAISNSGETAEVLAFVDAVSPSGAPVIAITGNRLSRLARRSRIFLDAHIEREADPLGLIATTSSTVETVVGDALAVAVMAKRRFGRLDFFRIHPGGTLGEQLRREFQHQGRL